MYPCYETCIFKKSYPIVQIWSSIYIHIHWQSNNTTKYLHQTIIIYKEDKRCELKVLNYILTHQTTSMNSYLVAHVSFCTHFSYWNPLSWSVWKMNHAHTLRLSFISDEFMEKNLIQLLPNRLLPSPWRLPSENLPCPSLLVHSM